MNADKRAIFILGVNGAGKSTFRDYSGIDITNFTIIDPDKIQKIDGLNELQAGKKAIHLFNDCLASNKDFILESTLAGKYALKKIEETKQSGYQIESYFIGLENKDLHIQRVKNRVKEGGHDIPNDVVIRRFDKSIGNLPDLIKLSNKTTIVDNSDFKQKYIPRLIISRNKIVHLNLNNNKCKWINNLAKNYKVNYSL